MYDCSLKVANVHELPSSLGSGETPTRTTSNNNREDASKISTYNTEISIVSGKFLKSMVKEEIKLTLCSGTIKVINMVSHQCFSAPIMDHN
jgi:hypothetical protein